MPLAHILHPRDHDLGGGFVVRRLLPAAVQRAVGPFLFFDHFGPALETPDAEHDVRPHPHIGLATVSYLFDGAIHHRDSIGSDQVITPGAVNWMSAGRGIVHSERRPESLQHSSYTNHGLQLWVALPQDEEEGDPFFHHTPADDITTLAPAPGVAVRVLVGSAFGVTSPVPAQGEVLYLDVALDAGARLELPALAEELGVYALDADVRVDGEALAARNMAVLKPGSGALLEADAPARLVVVGGAKLDAPRFLWWNFVSSRKERIAQAARDWAAQSMGQVPGDTEFIPLPDRPLPK
ncbi:pirin family protein [Xylophilus sp. GW821-FHT01B05]